jgi:hypothetical protein
MYTYQATSCRRRRSPGEDWDHKQWHAMRPAQEGRWGETRRKKRPLWDALSMKAWIYVPIYSRTWLPQGGTMKQSVVTWPNYIACEQTIHIVKHERKCSTQLKGHCYVLELDWLLNITSYLWKQYLVSAPPSNPYVCMCLHISHDRVVVVCKRWPTTLLIFLLFFRFRGRWHLAHAHLYYLHFKK